MKEQEFRNRTNPASQIRNSKYRIGPSKPAKSICIFQEWKFGTEMKFPIISSNSLRTGEFRLRPEFPLRSTIRQSTAERTTPAAPRVKVALHWFIRRGVPSFTKEGTTPCSTISPVSRRRLVAKEKGSRPWLLLVVAILAIV